MTSLLPEDEEYLDRTYPSAWKLVQASAAVTGLVIADFPVPSGLRPPTTSLLVLVPNGYPGSALDMFYFAPPIERSDGKPIAAVGPEEHFGRTWQRWSRHYQWEPGVDSMVRHLEYITSEIEQETRS